MSNDVGLFLLIIFFMLLYYLFIRGLGGNQMRVIPRAEECELTVVCPCGCKKELVVTVQLFPKWMPNGVSWEVIVKEVKELNKEMK